MIFDSADQIAEDYLSSNWRVSASIDADPRRAPLALSSNERNLLAGP